MILLDTHAFVWLAVEPRRLSRSATDAIRVAARGDGLAVASISLCEIAMLISRGRLTVRGTPERWLTSLVESVGAVVKELTPAVAVLSTQFPGDFSSDPADRIIAATARAEGFPLVTKDERIRTCALLKTIW